MWNLGQENLESGTPQAKYNPEETENSILVELPLLPLVPPGPSV